VPSKSKFIKWFAVAMICISATIVYLLETNIIPVRKSQVTNWTRGISEQSFVFISDN
jgi:hypothetical protein